MNSVSSYQHLPPLTAPIQVKTNFYTVKALQREIEELRKENEDLKLQIRTLQYKLSNVNKTSSK